MFSRTEHHVTRAEAAKMIRKAPAGTRFYVHLRADLPIADDPTQCFPAAGSGAVKISRRDAVKLALELYSDSLEARGARFPLALSQFVRSDGSKDAASYWIG